MAQAEARSVSGAELTVPCGCVASHLTTSRDGADRDAFCDGV